jgi:hypothetical protein
MGIPLMTPSNILPRDTPAICALCNHLLSRHMQNEDAAPRPHLQFLEMQYQVIQDWI